MYILRIEHPVPDYDAWKAAFDSDPIGRERSGREDGTRLGPTRRRRGRFGMLF